ncbi:MAG: glycerophosphodiester phosphodiesterase [Propionibacteriaceae bacterium]|nr:glycerophosphodiester phosphodiesterase [Propionibacteriaceae bacterium]
MADIPAVLAQPFIPIAHRGGSLYPANIGHENTLQAFQAAADEGFRYFETDVHVTKDGVLVAFHDSAVDRMTASSGNIAEYDYAELRKIPVDGHYSVPTMAELLAAFPDAFFNIDLKAAGTPAALAKVIQDTAAHDRVLVTSFSLRRLREFRRRIDRRVAQGAGVWVVAAQLVCFRLGIAIRLSPAVALQVPLRFGPLTVLTPRFIASAHRAGLKIHVWTIDDPAEMRRLIELGVDGILSDRIDVLKEVCVERGLW